MHHTHKHTYIDFFLTFSPGGPWIPCGPGSPCNITHGINHISYAGMKALLNESSRFEGERVCFEILHARSQASGQHLAAAKTTSLLCASVALTRYVLTMFFLFAAALSAGRPHVWGEEKLWRNMLSCSTKCAHTGSFSSSHIVLWFHMYYRRGEVYKQNTCGI